MSEFEDIVKNGLADDEFIIVDIGNVPVAYNTTISAGKFVRDKENHDHTFLAFQLVFENCDVPFDFIVPTETELGQAILSGDLSVTAWQRVEEFDE